MRKLIFALAALACLVFPGKLMAQQQDASTIFSYIGQHEFLVRNFQNKPPCTHLPLSAENNCQLLERMAPQTDDFLALLNARLTAFNVANVADPTESAEVAAIIKDIYAMARGYAKTIGFEGTPYIVVDIEYAWMDAQGQIVLVSTEVEKEPFLAVTIYATLVKDDTYVMLEVAVPREDPDNPGLYDVWGMVPFTLILKRAPLT